MQIILVNRVFMIVWGWRRGEDTGKCGNWRWVGQQPPFSFSDVVRVSKINYFRVLCMIMSLHFSCHCVQAIFVISVCGTVETTNSDTHIHMQSIKSAIIWFYYTIMTDFILCELNSIVLPAYNFPSYKRRILN